MASCILYQNDDASISIVDIPRSIEIAQGPALSQRRLLSAEPLKEPFPPTEPKSRKAKERLREQSLNDLLLSKHLQFALDEVKTSYKAQWCLPRVVEANGKKRKRDHCDLEDIEEGGNTSVTEDAGDEFVKLIKSSEGDCFYDNSSNEPLLFREDSSCKKGRFPPNSTLLCGDITTTKATFISAAPKFDLIVMDPPWPNRSARRKKSYSISYGNTEIKKLLSSIPIESKLAEDGTVAVWVTNREAFRDMLLQPGGLFDEWGITLVEEWIWLKTTVTGEPICLLDSVWRKPYEILLVGRGGIQQPPEVKRRVLIAVPGLHSRKPNLKTLFDRFLQKENYEALEIFARNMTAGWWSWGYELLKFQMDEYWLEDEGY
jgi:N6-adenosine-specific RNA methylase IME4